MLHQILCLQSTSSGTALAVLAAATQQAAIHTSIHSFQRLSNAQPCHTEFLAAATAAAGHSHSSATSAKHTVQTSNHHQHCTADTTVSNDQQGSSIQQQQPSPWTTNAAAAAPHACHPQQQQVHFLQQQWHSCWLVQQHQRQQQQQLLQGPSSFWLVGQAWRGLQHPNKPVPKSRKPPAASKPKPDVKKPQMRRNTQITAPIVMVIMPDGSKQEMQLSAALAAAADLGLDLVEVNAKGQPPVARVMDWGKFVYEQQQKADAADKLRRQQQKLSTPKEMQFSARIADHDLEVKMRKVAGWLDQGYRVQLVVKHGREEEAAAAEALDYLLARVQADYNVEAGAQQQQRRAVSLLVKPLGAPGEAAKNKAAEELSS